MGGAIELDAGEILSREMVYDHWYRLVRVIVRMPDGAEVERHIFSPGIGACVLPYDPNRRVALIVKMPRAVLIDANAGPLIETIGGRVVEGCEPATQARQEALEEAGVALGKLELVTTIWPAVHVSSERVSLYLATYSEKDKIASGGGCPEEHENITAEEVSLVDMYRTAETGALHDARAVILIQALRLRRPDLFL